MPIFDMSDVYYRSSVINLLQKNIHAPFVKAQFSTLGGEENVSILLAVSLDKKEDWQNGYFENSHSFRFHIFNNGKTNQFVGRPRMRQFTAKTIEDVVVKINKFLNIAKETLMGVTREDIMRYGTEDEIAFLKEYRGEDIGIPHSPVGDEKYCEKCGEGMGKMTNKRWERKGRICDTCAREEHLDKETR